MKLFNTISGIFLGKDGQFRIVEEQWDTLINREGLFDYLEQTYFSPKRNHPGLPEKIPEAGLLAPIGTQEVWAAGVTYLRSREARKEESAESGAASFYSKVYEAPRPELFFKALPHRVAAHNSPVYIRRDSQWNVPEPELTLFINSKGNIQGYTIGNDMSSRDIEGENPLYLPQAKIYERSAALGPCLYVPKDPLPPNTVISLLVRTKDQIRFQNTVEISQMRRKFGELIEYLLRECSFEQGVYLMTGTGIVPPNDFTLMEGDLIEISIDPIGKLVNTVSFR